jgi:hypothetical protein
MRKSFCDSCGGESEMKHLPYHISADFHDFNKAFHDFEVCAPCADRLGLATVIERLIESKSTLTPRLKRASS